jgi:hypothetical protein
MGACGIEMIVPEGEDPMEAFKTRWADDRHYYGADPYSGSFATFRTVTVDRDKVFTATDEAMDYCLDHSEKWHNCVAVKVHDEAAGKRYWLIAGWAAM